MELNRAGQTMIMVTHNPELAARYAGRTIRITDGRIAEDTGAAATAATGATGARLGTWETR
jgi:ABC-type lipoprotein export system ATPase subunit